MSPRNSFVFPHIIFASPLKILLPHACITSLAKTQVFPCSTFAFQSKTSASSHENFVPLQIFAYPFEYFGFFFTILLGHFSIFLLPLEKLNCSLTVLLCSSAKLLHLFTKILCPLVIFLRPLTTVSRCLAKFKCSLTIFLLPLVMIFHYFSMQNLNVPLQYFCVLVQKFCIFLRNFFLPLPHFCFTFNAFAILLHFFTILSHSLTIIFFPLAILLRSLAKLLSSCAIFLHPPSETSLVTFLCSLAKFLGLHTKLVFSCNGFASSVNTSAFPRNIFSLLVFLSHIFAFSHLLSAQQHKMQEVEKLS